MPSREFSFRHKNRKGQTDFKHWKYWLYFEIEFSIFLDPFFFTPRNSHEIREGRDILSVRIIMEDYAQYYSALPPPMEPSEDELLPRLPRSLPFDALVFIIEDRITGLVQLPYTEEQVYGSLFYLQVIRPIVASLILPCEEPAEEIATDRTVKKEHPSAAASIRASHKAAPTPPPPPKPYTFSDQHRGIVAALLVARLEFLDSASDGGRFGQRHRSTTEDMMFKERGVLEARAYTAELVALKFLSFMTLETDRIEFLTYEYNTEQDGLDDGEGRTVKTDTGVSAKIDDQEHKKQYAAMSSRSMVHLPLRNHARSRSSSISHSRAPSPKGRQPISIKSQQTIHQNLFYLPGSVDDKHRNALFHPSSYDGRFKSNSFTESSPLLGTSPINTRSFDNPFAEDLLSAATNPTRNSTTKSASKKNWGDSPHDRLIEHSLFIEQYADRSALDLAMVGSQPAREFISSDAVQRVVAGIWSGRIMYWRTIEAGSKKSVHLYNPRNHVDWYSRLRVPRYRSFFMMINYSILMALFYVLLFRRHHDGSAGIIEGLMHFWFIGFVLDELSQAMEAGSFNQYLADFWSFFDICIVGIFMVFAVLRVLGIILDDEGYSNTSFDILSLEAVLLVPRLFSFLFVFPYFGTLLPCLRDLTMEFCKFFVIIAIIYVGFFTTFSFLGRQTFTFDQMSWLLVRVFFGSSFSGFDAAPQISPVFGPILMLVFVTLTNILLITILISILSQRFSTIMLNARQEYALHFSYIVIESVNTSDRVTYFYPPLNILGALLRPVRIFMKPNSYKAFRISILKATHWPFVAVVYAFEYATLGMHRHRAKRYMKIRKDRRLSVAQRVIFQHPSNPFTGLRDEEESDSGSENSDIEDMEVEIFSKQRKSRVFAGKTVKYPVKGDVIPDQGNVWKPSETFFPRFKRHPKKRKMSDG